MPTPQTIQLEYCTRCGGPLTLVNEADPDQAARTGQWTETYECQGLCGQRGTYIVDDRAGRERGSGVVLA